MIHRNLWRPDTCDCALEYEWDDAQDEATRRHSISRIVQACLAHATVMTAEQHYDIVLAENRQKNRLYGAILDSLPSAVRWREQDDGTTIRELQPGKEFGFSYDAQRRLVLDLKGFTEAERTVLRSLPLFSNPGVVVL